MGQQQLLLIILGVIIVGIAVAVGITMFQSNAVQSNRDAVLSDMNMIASQVQAYYRKPIAMGGGGGSFNSDAELTKIFKRQLKNDNGSYAFSGTSATQTTLTGTGREVLTPGGSDTVGATVLIKPDSLFTTIVH